MTYDFQPIGPTGVPMTAAEVPVQAQVLLLTRLPYLTDDQRREVLATTAIGSGYPLLDGNTWDGWGRLNYYAAADGYGAFNSNVTVTMDASHGGFNAVDAWRNNISGAGSLTKEGTGQLSLTGDNTFSGGVNVHGGKLIALSATALGTGDVEVGGGTLVDAVVGVLNLGGKYSQDADGTLGINTVS
jgi:autotransporter-associated beta strand protein